MLESFFAVCELVCRCRGREGGLYAPVFRLPQAEELKTKGNESLKSNKVDEAIELYTQAIELDPENHVLYSNRSAAYLQADKHSEALKDAEKTVKLNRTWAKVRVLVSLLIHVQAV